MPQVFSNAFAGTIACILWVLWDGEPLPLLLGMFLGHYGCCCGDTWASETGIAFSKRLRTPSHGLQLSSIQVLCWVDYLPPV